MKKLLLSFAIIGLVSLVSCGASDEEKKAMQEANEEIVDEKVDEIMQKLEASSSEQEMVADSAASSEEAPAAE